MAKFEQVFYVGVIVYFYSCFSLTLCVRPSARTTVDDLVRKWAPLIWLAPGEQYWPINVEEYLDHIFVADKDDNIVMPSIDERIKDFPSERFHLRTYRSVGRIFKNNTSGLLIDQHGNAIWLLDDKITRWKEYIEELYKNEEPKQEEISGEEESLINTKNEIAKAVRIIKNNKTPGTDRVHGEILKLLEDNGLDILYELEKDNQSLIYGKDPTQHGVSIYALVTHCGGSNITEKEVNDSSTDDLYFHVTYWIFYPLNEGKDICFIANLPTPEMFENCPGKTQMIGKHIGDWEHMSLSFAGKPVPELLFLAVHDTGGYYRYNEKGQYFKYEFPKLGLIQVPKYPQIVHTREGHPVLFSASGSHGSWSVPGKLSYVQVAYINVPGLRDHTNYGTPWETWNNVKIYHKELEPLPHWIYFRGRWGNLRTNCMYTSKLGLCEYFDGPPGILDRSPDFYCHLIRP